MPNNDAFSQIAGAISGGIDRMVKLLEVSVTGWKSFYLPAEPFIQVFDFTLAASQALNNQAIDLRLDFDYYVYALAFAATGPITFLYKASGGGVFFGNAQVRSDSLFSAAEPVLWLRRPFKVAKTASLSVDLTDISVLANVGQLNLIGWKAVSKYAEE